MEVEGSVYGWDWRGKSRTDLENFVGQAKGGELLRPEGRQPQG